MEADIFGPEWRVIAKLGEGSFAEVYKVKSLKNQNFYAIKMLKKRYRSVEEVNRLPEIMALRALQGCPNIIKFAGVLYDSQHMCLALVFELLDQNLFELIRDNQQPFDEKINLLLIYQLLKGLYHMHKKNLFHRDIKPENCMVNKGTFELKLADFGSTRQTSDTGPFTEYVATRWYRAPECILTSGSYGPAVDIWAVGCVLYEVLTTRPLFPGKHQLDQIARIHNILGTPNRDVLNQFRQNPNTQINYAFPFRAKQEFQVLLPGTSPEIIDLLSKLLVYDPAGRITAQEALKHPAFELFRRYEPIYEHSAKDIPFSQFVLEKTADIPLYNHVTEAVDLTKTTPITLIQQAVLAQVEEPPPQQQQQPKPRQPIRNIMGESSKQAPIIHANLADSRRMAIERLKVYKQHQNSKPLMQGPAIRKPIQPLHFGPPKVIKPIVLPHVTGNPYQKPSADLLKPRINSIQFH